MESKKGTEVDLHFLKPTRALLVANEFIKFYYSMLNKSPPIMHRFYMKTSMFKHNKLPVVVGQKAIHECIMGLNLKDSIVALTHLDAQESIDGGIVVQVTGNIHLSTGQDRPFMQMFVLAPQTENKFVVLNDVFIYDDENKDETKKEDDKASASETEVAVKEGEQLPEVPAHSAIETTSNNMLSENILQVLQMQGAVGSATSSAAALSPDPDDKQIAVSAECVSLEQVAAEQNLDEQNLELKATESLTNIPTMLICAPNEQLSASDAQISPVLVNNQAQFHNTDVCVAQAETEQEEPQIWNLKSKPQFREFFPNMPNTQNQRAVEELSNAASEEQSPLQKTETAGSTNSLDSQFSYTKQLTASYVSAALGQYTRKAPLDNNNDACRMCPNNLFNLDSSYYDEFPPVNSKRKIKQKTAVAATPLTTGQETTYQGKPTYAYLVKAKVSKETILRIIEEQLAHVSKTKTVKRKQKVNIRINPSPKSKGKAVSKGQKSQQKAEQSEDLGEPLLMPTYESNYKKSRRYKTLLKYSDRINAKRALLATTENETTENTQQNENATDPPQEVINQDVGKSAEEYNVATKDVVSSGENNSDQTKVGNIINGNNEEQIANNKTEKVLTIGATSKSKVLKNNYKNAKKPNDDTGKLGKVHTTRKPTEGSVESGKQIVNRDKQLPSGNQYVLDWLDNGKPAAEQKHHRVEVDKKGTSSAVANSNTITNNKNNFENQTSKKSRPNAENKKDNKIIDNKTNKVVDNKAKNADGAMKHKANEVKVDATGQSKDVTANMQNNDRQRTQNMRAGKKDTSTFKPYQLFVGRVPYNATKDDLRNIFSEFGSINDIALLKAPNSNVPNYSFVTFSNRESMVKCLSSRPIYYPSDSNQNHRLNVEQRKNPNEPINVPKDGNRSRVFTNKNFKY